MTHDPTFWLSRDEVRELDRRAIHGYGVPGVVLMENAGRGAAELLMRLNPERKPVVILCGHGNNGGDGFVMARHLDNHGWPVDVHVLAQNKKAWVDNEYRPGDADINFDILFTAGIHFTQYHPEHVTERQADFLRKRLKNPVWVVDALFGTGLTRPLAEPYSGVVVDVNASGNPVLAVDIPSGLDCDTGEPLGPTVRATHTATFVALKKGFLNPKSRAWTGEVHVIDIGAPRKLVDEFRPR
jgi:NAD(P)H-hydrate epimerase